MNWIEAPFSHIVIDEFLSEDEFLMLIDALTKEEYVPKKSDLFQLKQTNELAEKDSLAPIKKRLLDLNLPKTTNINCSGTLYEDTDYLLCHDDQLDDRKFAFILYLTSLSASQGGSLRLFASKNNIPVKIAKEIQPKENRLVIFQVSTTSFHDVKEVISAQRLALGGWYV